MFGCLAVYVGDKIVLILRDRSDETDDNGVWLATTEEHHQSLRREFSNMRSIRLFGKEVTGWQVLGKVPGARRASGSGAKKTAKFPKRAKAPKRAAKDRAR